MLHSRVRCSTLMQKSEMSKQFRILAVVAALMAPMWASANVITTSGNLATGTVNYFSFDVINSGDFNLSLTSNSFDTELFLFRAPASNTNFLEADDDGGTGLNSFIDRYLSVGHYVAAIGAYDLSLSEAINGLNTGTSFSWSDGNGPWDLRISSYNGTSVATARAVSEPGTIGLLGAGLVALALVRRRKAA
jgi:hypothetical protein